MKRSTKIISVVVIFFLVIATIIVARQMIGMHFKKKFGKRPPPGLIVAQVVNNNFSEKIESFGTAIPYKTQSFRVKKSELLSDLKLNEFIKKGEIVAKLKEGNIVAPFDGILGKRGLSEDVLGSENLFIITLDDSSIIIPILKYLKYLLLI